MYETLEMVAFCLILIGVVLTFSKRTHPVGHLIVIAADLLLATVCMLTANYWMVAAWVAVALMVVGLLLAKRR